MLKCYGLFEPDYTLGYGEVQSGAVPGGTLS